MFIVQTSIDRYKQEHSFLQKEMIYVSYTTSNH